VRQLAGPMLIVWDRLPAHRSRLVADFVRHLEGLIVLEYLPAYAPELNPVEYLWAHWKHHQLPNVCAKDLWQLNEGARRTLGRLRRRPRLITALWRRRKVAVWFGVRFQLRPALFFFAVSQRFIRQTLVSARIWDSAHPLYFL